MADDDWRKAKSLLLGAVDSILKKEKKERVCHHCSTPPPEFEPQTIAKPKKLSVYEEHRRLFGYQPSKTCSKIPKKSLKPKNKAQKIALWTKDVVCLRDRTQDTSPNTEEKIELAQLSLSKKLVFPAEGDAAEVHDIILSNFPILSECGGYTLMRTADNSRSLVAVEGPDGGTTVPFLKDILRQARLYIRPLQSDIEEYQLKILNREAKEVTCVILIL